MFRLLIQVAVRSLPNNYRKMIFHLPYLVTVGKDGVASVLEPGSLDDAVTATATATATVEVAF
jgi:hypothetical protein